MPAAMMSQRTTLFGVQGAQTSRTLEDFLNLPGIVSTFGAIVKRYGERLTGEDAYKKSVAKLFGDFSEGLRAYISVTVDGQQAGALRAEVITAGDWYLIASVEFSPDSAYFSGGEQVAGEVYENVFGGLAAKATQTDDERKELLRQHGLLILQSPNFEADTVMQKAIELNYSAALGTARAFKTPEFQRALKEFTAATQTIEAQKQALEAQGQNLRQELIGSGAVAALNYAIPVGLIQNNQ